MTSVDKQAWDCLMIGAGPASLAAAVYTAREDIKTLIVEKDVIGGLAAKTAHIDNYPGFSHGVAGLELAQQLQGQAERFGAEIRLAEVTDIRRVENGCLAVSLKDEPEPITAKTVLIATGSEYKKLNIAGEEAFYGRGVHNCATCDGAFYRDKRLAVVGSGNSSAQESLFLTKFAKSIDIFIRGEAWKASSVLQEEIRKAGKIKVHFNARLTEIKGQSDRLTSVAVSQDGRSDYDLAVDGVFVFIGLRPVSGYFDKDLIKLDEAGFVLTDDNLATSLKGVFCAGDVRSGATMQIAAAIGEGARAALSIREYLESSA